MNDYQPIMRAIQRRLPLLVLISLLLAAATYGVLARRGPTYQVHFSYLISLAQREHPPEYTFDGYYALQATDLFTATLAGWLQTPEMIVAAYQTAGVPLPSADARRLLRTVTARKTAPQLVEVTVTAKEARVAEKVAAALITVTEKNVALYQDKGIPALAFTVVATSPWTSSVVVARGAIAASVGVAALLLLVNAHLLWEATAHAHRD